MLGPVLAIIAASCWAFGAMFARLGLSQGIKPSTGTFISSVSSFAIVAIAVLVTSRDDLLLLTPIALLWFALIGVVNYVMGRQFNYAAINRIGVVRASPLFATAPLFAMILAVSFIGEAINPAIVIGTLTIVAGVYLVVTSQ